MLEKLNLFDLCNKSGVDVKMNGFVFFFKEKSPFKMPGLFFSSKLNWELSHCFYC